MPAPAEIIATRKGAGLTQAEAAAFAGYGQPGRWAEIEAGTRQIDPVRWEYFLHRAGLRRLPFRRSAPV